MDALRMLGGGWTGFSGTRGAPKGRGVLDWWRLLSRFVVGSVDEA